MRQVAEYNLVEEKYVILQEYNFFGVLLLQKYLSHKRFLSTGKMNKLIGDKQNLSFTLARDTDQTIIHSFDQEPFLWRLEVI